MMRSGPWCVLALLLTLAAAPVEAAEQRWVVSEGTTLKSEAALAAATVAELAVGTAVTVLEDAGRWLKVEAGEGKQGWVYSGRVAATPPVQEVTGQDGTLFGATVQESQIATAKADSARSIRGLSPETSAYAKQRGTPAEYRQALDKILARSVSDKELKSFLRDGKLGEYAP